jgi:type IV secretory pathway VirB10-like protein
VDCGARTGLDWRRPSGWRVPVAIAAVTLIALGVAGGLIATEVSDDEEVSAEESFAEYQRDQQQQQAQPPAPAPAPATPTPTTPAPAPATPTPPAAPEPEPEPAPPAGGSPGGEGGGEPQSWPAGKSAYTVILLSTDQRVGAERKAREVAAAGLPAGLLRSNNYPSLRPGYWVVFVGQYDSVEEASRRADRIADQGFPGGYPRYVESR